MIYKVTEQHLIHTLDKDLLVTSSPIDLDNNKSFWYNPYSGLFTVNYNSKTVLKTISQQEAFDKYNKIKV